MGLHEAPGDRQPKTDTGGGGIDVLDLGERLGQGFQAIGWDAGAGIRDCDHHVLLQALGFHRHRPTRRRVVDRIGHQLGHNPTEGIAVRHDRQGRREFRCDHRDPRRIGLIRDGLQELLQRRREIQALHQQAKLARLDFPEMQDVVDDAQQVVAGLANVVKVLALLAGHGPADALRQKVREADDGIQRGPELVAHRGEKAALGLVGHLRRPAGAFHEPEGKEQDQHNDDRQTDGVHDSHPMMAVESRDPVADLLPDHDMAAGQGRRIDDSGIVGERQTVGRIVRTVHADRRMPRRRRRDRRATGRESPGVRPGCGLNHAGPGRRPIEDDGDARIQGRVQRLDQGLQRRADHHGPDDRPGPVIHRGDGTGTAQHRFPVVDLDPRPRAAVGDGAGDDRTVVGGSVAEVPRGPDAQESDRFRAQMKLQFMDLEVRHRAAPGGTKMLVEAQSGRRCLQVVGAAALRHDGLPPRQKGFTDMDVGGVKPGDGGQHLDPVLDCELHHAAQAFSFLRPGALHVADGSPAMERHERDGGQDHEKTRQQKRPGSGAELPSLRQERR